MLEGDHSEIRNGNAGQRLVTPRARYLRPATYYQLPLFRAASEEQEPS